jgi:glycosyltransferase involved in cell wall biosynthesis
MSSSQSPDVSAATGGKAPGIVLFMAAHEPFDDPRVSWAASRIAQRHESVVLGLAAHDGQAPDIESRQGFHVLRFSRHGVSRSFMNQAFRIITGLTFRQNAKLRRAALFLSPLLAIGLPFLWLFELAYGLLRRLVATFLDLRHTIVSLSNLTPNTATIVRAGWRLFRDRFTGSAGSRPVASSKWADFKWLLRHILGSNETFVRHVAEDPSRYVAVYCHDLDTLYAGIHLKLMFGLPVIYDAHENWPHANPGSPWYHIQFFTWFERALIREADVVMTVSDQLAAELKQRHGLTDVLVMPNAEPFQETLPDALVTEMTGLAGDRVRFLFQGAFAPDRGLDQLLDYWSSVDGSKAALFLRGRQNLERDRLERKARDLGLLGVSIFFLKPVTEDELIPAAREADVGIIPYRNDLPAYVVACPNKLSQYMQSGCAILTADLPFVSKLVREAHAGATYDFRNRESFVAAVDSLSDRAAISVMKANAREYTRDVYHWDAFAPQMMARLDTVVAARTQLQPVNSGAQA